MMTSTIPEQTAFTINKDIAHLLAKFLREHGYEFRRLFDQFQEIKRDPIFGSVPSMESREIWIELVDLLKGEANPDDPPLYRLRMPSKSY